MIDVQQQLGAVARVVADRDVDGRPAKVVTLEQTYPTDLDDLWDAVTNQERIPRWFANVTGELRLGGSYQVENNANGTITACDPPRGFDATWEFGGGVSWIEVRLTAVDQDQARLSLSHIAHPEEHWAMFGPGAVGVGWDLGFLGLALHITAGIDVPVEATEWAASAEAIDFMTGSGHLWAAADIASGTDPETANSRATATIGFYTGATPAE